MNDFMKSIICRNKFFWYVKYFYLVLSAVYIKSK